MIAPKSTILISSSVFLEITARLGTLPVPVIVLRLLLERSLSLAAVSVLRRKKIFTAWMARTDSRV